MVYPFWLLTLETKIILNDSVTSNTVVIIVVYDFAFRVEESVDRNL